MSGPADSESVQQKVAGSKPKRMGIGRFVLKKAVTTLIHRQTASSGTLGMLARTAEHTLNTADQLTQSAFEKSAAMLFSKQIGEPAAKFVGRRTWGIVSKIL